jgi:hypothetical protein
LDVLVGCVVGVAAVVVPVVAGFVVAVVPGFVVGGSCAGIDVFVCPSAPAAFGRFLSDGGSPIEAIVLPGGKNAITTMSPL